MRRIVAGVLVGAMFLVAGREAFAQSSAPADIHPLLDVPYMPQTPELCGGAAVAMVLRYWGARDVFPQDFAPLVGPGAGGILTGVLESAVRDRGWQASVLPAADDGSHTIIRSHVDRGRPLIALIEVAPRTYHYVVIVGSTDEQVVLHDPARGPYRTMRWSEFDRVSMAAGRWVMLVLPPEGFRPDEEASSITSAPAEVAVLVVETPCSALVDRSVLMAIAGDREGAEQGLVAATVVCPNDPASWRELAGLRFSQSRWSEAQDLALLAARLAPEDPYVWQLVATSRYLMGDATGALDAWNHTGNPRIDTIDIHGVDRTPQPIVARSAGLQPRQVLTPGTLGRAQRRLRELPVATSATIRYAPVVAKDAGEQAKVDVFVDERQVVPHGWPALATLGARALILNELRVDVAGALGAGELASVSWRWPAPRPRVSLSLALPSPQWLPGIVSVDGSWERQSYDAAASSGDVALMRETRRTVGFRVADWSSHWLRWQTGIARDRFDARDYLAVDGALDARLASDRLALAASAGWWAPFAGGDRLATGGVLAAWRSSIDAASPSWSAVTDVTVAGQAAPLALWPGAGTGHARNGLLRAHPLLDDDVVAGSVFGRAVAHGTLEYSRPIAQTLAGGLSLAGFVDTARAWHRLNRADPSPLYVDAGLGLRVHAAGLAGAIRIDLAHGLRGGGTVLSAGWGNAWPR